MHVTYCCGSKRGILYLTTSCMWPGFCCSFSPLGLLRSSSFTVWSLETSGLFSGCFRLVCHSCRMCSSHSHSRYERKVYKELLLKDDILRYTKSWRQGDCYIELKITVTSYTMRQIPLRDREEKNTSYKSRYDPPPTPAQMSYTGLMKWKCICTIKIATTKQTNKRTHSQKQLGYRLIKQLLNSVVAKHSWFASTS